jgi:hypothetical protein
MIKFIILIGLFMSLNSQAQIKTLHNAEDILNQANLLPDGSIIFLDVDDTLITPKSDSFRIKSSEINIIDQIKAEQKSYPNYQNIISNWRLNREIILTEAIWPNVIQKIKEKHRVFALTKIDTGVFGNISSMEEWRYHELKLIGIDFSEIETMHQINSSNRPSYYRGIFMTGKAKKSEVLKIYLSLLQPSHIMFVDDRMEYLQDVSNFCTKNNIPFSGVYYRGVDKISGSFNPKIASIQKEHLISKAIWLEDDEAAKLLD